MPQLTRLILNGGSRHRLSKGFLLRNAMGTEKEWGCTCRFLEIAGRSLLQDRELERFQVSGTEKHPGMITLITPFMAVFTFEHREEFCRLLAKSIAVLNEAVKPSHHLLGIGLEPFAAVENGNPPDLCADLHQIEVLDEDEIERIYNLFRQYLPELIAITSNSPLRNGKVQGDFSQRMRLNASSFLPHYISQFTASRLDQIKRMMRKDHGLGDLRQMDINPLGEKTDLPELETRELLDDFAPAIELRFSDAQCSLPFLRAVIILLQAIAIQGRALTRRGGRVPYMQHQVIDSNKARAIQRGLTALFQPDPKFSNPKDPGSRYHKRPTDEQAPERARGSLLNLLETSLLPSLHSLGCRGPELLPLVLGLELRRRGRQCLANYAEYQQFLAHKRATTLDNALIEDWKLLLTYPGRDLMTEKNRAIYPAISSEIEQMWEEKLLRSHHAFGTGTEGRTQSGKGDEHGN